MIRLPLRASCWMGSRPAAGAGSDASRHGELECPAGGLRGAQPGAEARDAQIADVVGLAALNLLTGAFNLVAGIERAATT